MKVEKGSREGKGSGGRERRHAFVQEREGVGLP